MDKLVCTKLDIDRAIGKIITKLLDIEPEFVPIAILNGGKFLARKIFGSKVYYITTSSYVDNKKLPNDEIIIDMEGVPDVKDKTVILIDDIYDTGNTLHKVNQRLIKLGAKDVKNIVLIKRTCYHSYNVDLFAFGIELKTDEFLVGCGMDYDGKYRDLPYIISVKEKINAKNSN